MSLCKLIELVPDGGRSWPVARGVAGGVAGGVSRGRPQDGRVVALPVRGLRHLPPRQLRREQAVPVSNTLSTAMSRRTK